MPANRIRPLPLRDVKIEGPFWERYIKLVREKVIPYQWEALNDRIPDAAQSHCIKNFEIAAGKRQGSFYGMIFQDSDLYKWLECVAFCLETNPDPELEALADNTISLIGSAQSSDGYINTYYTIKEPEGRWKNLQDGHELYCAGHLIEAAVAYTNATGKRVMLGIAARLADCIDNAFGPGKDKINGYPGHQEIELALYLLYEATGENRYLDLSDYFIRQRGSSPNYFDAEQEKPGFKRVFPELALYPRTYSQSHMPPAEQREAVGHAVRAVYMYSAMADLAAETGDKTLEDACDALYEDIAGRKMYITGAIGSVSTGERFSHAYYLPNDLIYGETCASVGLMMFCRRMNAIHGKAKYADTMERALYNTVLAGVSIAGTEFYYVNPLEADPLAIRDNPNYGHVKPVRQKWFDCACCPSNIARTVMGLGRYVYGTSADGLYVNLYCEGAARDGRRYIEVKTSYPFDDTAKIKAEGGSYKLYLRNPEAAPVLSVSIDGEDACYSPERGYIALEREWQGEIIEVKFDMLPRFVYSSVQVQNNVGKSAVMRGPIVYCIEEADNGGLLGTRLLAGNAGLAEIPPPDGLIDGIVALKAQAWRYRDSGNGLYMEAGPALERCDLTLIPYFLWANRGVNEMRVFIPVLPG